MRILVRMMENGILEIKTCGTHALSRSRPQPGWCRDEDDVEAATKELLDLITRHKRRSQLNIDLPLKVNLGTESEQGNICRCQTKARPEELGNYSP